MHMNRVMLIGNVVKDPEIRFAGPAQTPVTDLRVAVNRNWKTTKGEKKEETLFIDVQVWARQAEMAVQYLKKGRLIAIEGCLSSDEWIDAGGKRQSRVFVKSERLVFLPPSQDGQKSAEPDTE